MAVARMWGYKPDGSACVFAVPSGGALPPGWSSDVTVIADPALRTGEKVSAAAGKTILEPVAVTPEAKAALKQEVAKKEVAAGQTLRYDENNRPLPAAKQRIG